MRKHLSFTSIIGVLALSISSTGAAVTPKKLPDGAQYSVYGGTLRVEFWSPEIVRVTYAATAEWPALKSLSVVANPATVRLTRGRKTAFNFHLRQTSVKVSIEKQTGAVSFLDPPATFCFEKRPMAANSGRPP